MQSAETKALEISDIVLYDHLDHLFLTERLLKSVGDETKLADVVPIGNNLKPVPRTPGTGGGVVVVFRQNFNIEFRFMSVLFCSLEPCLKVVTPYCSLRC